MVFCKFSQQQPGNHAHVVYMGHRFGVFKFNNTAEGVNHLGAVFTHFFRLLPQRPCLFSHQLPQVKLLGILLNDVVDALDHDIWIKGLGDNIRCPHLIAALHNALTVLSSNHDDRDTASQAHTLHFCQDTETVEHWHDKIQKHNRDILALPLQDFQRLRTVFSFIYGIFCLEHLAQQRAVQLHIVNDEYLSFFCLVIHKQPP